MDSHDSNPQRRRYEVLRGFLRFDAREQGALLGYLAKWITLGAIVGVLAGLGSAAFLKSLDWATRTREAHSWLLFALPLAGFVVGLGYHYGGGRSSEGNHLIIDEIHEPKAWIPRAWLRWYSWERSSPICSAGRPGARAPRSRWRAASPTRRFGPEESRRPTGVYC